MAGKKSELGPSGTAVWHNVQRLREKQRLSYAELSRNLAEMGREIPPLGLRRIESGERRVDADDLVALAIALGVTPATLLMPSAATDDVEVEVTGPAMAVSAVRLWNWLVARQPLDGSTDSDVGDSADDAAVKFMRWMQWAVEVHPDWMVGDLAEAVKRGLPEGRARTVFESGVPSRRIANRRGRES
ncbi:helix-turn-helix transcriptional regulator [Mycolicibacterium sp. 141076]|uniref:helix-turn-helix domain-containing protein n=1 Tax=Mycobacteriaceae TaxID=1762 RepID=UPI00299E1067|nr:helix-turn-helix transcriptional regulator [Mycolicibacterium sp. 141076]MDX1880094.1 helix-turn-helix transcriptional regulator [Mycolicibacterium sp. 141076]